MAGINAARYYPDKLSHQIGAESLHNFTDFNILNKSGKSPNQLLLFEL